MDTGTEKVLKEDGLMVGEGWGLHTKMRYVDRHWRVKLVDTITYEF